MPDAIERCNHCQRVVDRADDSTTLNCYDLCRRCWKDKSPPEPWKKQDGTGGYIYGCYFPYTDLNVGEMGGRGTGRPKDVEWL